jgi:Leucine-rich repeat (LRR) protein
MSQKLILKAKEENAKYLNLEENSLRAVPIELFDCTSLTKLNLSNNKINEISSDIHRLQDLEILTLYCNKLVTLPPVINQLKSLLRLVLRYIMRLKKQ